MNKDQLISEIIRKLQSNYIYIPTISKDSRPSDVATAVNNIILQLNTNNYDLVKNVITIIDEYHFHKFNNKIEELIEEKK